MEPACCAQFAVPEPAMQCFHLTTCSSAGPFSRLPCTAFSWCSQQTCFEPDAHTHSLGDCWLKFTEGPLNPEVRTSQLFSLLSFASLLCNLAIAQRLQVNMRGTLPDDYRIRHPTAPKTVQWHSGDCYHTYACIVSQHCHIKTCGSELVMMSNSTSSAMHNHAACCRQA